MFSCWFQLWLHKKKKKDPQTKCLKKPLYCAPWFCESRIQEALPGWSGFYPRGVSSGGEDWRVYFQDDSFTHLCGAWVLLNTSFSSRASQHGLGFSQDGSLRITTLITWQLTFKSYYFKGLRWKQQGFFWWELKAGGQFHCFLLVTQVVKTHAYSRGVKD